MPPQLTGLAKARAEGRHANVNRECTRRRSQAVLSWREGGGSGLGGALPANNEVGIRSGLLRAYLRFSFKNNLAKAGRAVTAEGI